jgi:hypothetical protein
MIKRKTKINFMQHHTPEIKIHKALNTSEITDHGTV